VIIDKIARSNIPHDHHLPSIEKIRNPKKSLLCK